MQLEFFDSGVPTLEYFVNRSNTANWTIEPAVTDFIDLTYILNGCAVYTINGQQVSVCAGDVLCIPKNSQRSAISKNPIAFESFAANFFLHDFKTGEEMEVPLPLISNVGIHGDIVSLYRRLNENWLSRNPGYVMTVRAHLMLILQRFMSLLVYEVNAYQYDLRVKQAIRYMTDNYAKNITITEVAENVSLNPVYFGALFKKETHTTFRDYLNSIRLNQAEDMLRLGKWNVTEVAQNCGFSDVFYFSRLFKKYKGVPPSTLR